METIDTLKITFDKLENEDKITNNLKNEILKIYSSQANKIEKLEKRLSDTIDTLKHIRTLLTVIDCPEHESLIKTIMDEIKEEVEK